MSHRGRLPLGGMDRQPLRDWVHRYNDQGPDGLCDVHAGGIAPRLIAPRGFLTFGYFCRDFRHGRPAGTRVDPEYFALLLSTLPTLQLSRPPFFIGWLFSDIVPTLDGSDIFTF